MRETESLPTRWQALKFAAKACGLRLRRTIREMGGRPPLLTRCEVAPGARVLGESHTPLYGSALAAEFALQAGKVQNLRVSARKLNGLVMRAGQTFSFWRHVPRPSARGGFAPGRELREGCVVPSTGGGLCQLTNALYDCALQAGCEIVERHAHSRRLPGSAAEVGRDATVFWNYMDLRFRAEADCQIEVRLTQHELHVRILALTANPVKSATIPKPEPPPAETAESCETCGIVSCFRNPAATSLPQHAQTAWLLDAWWPEYDDYLRAHRQPDDTLLTPLDSRRWNIGPYRWHSKGFAKVRQAPWFVIRRALASRRLASQGAARQRVLLRFDEELARIFARRIPYTATHLVISQNLLPFLWREGVLDGRTFDVLMTRLPLTELHATLDRAAKLHGDSPTLADFRADPRLVADEAAALAEARFWITPHSKIAALAGTCAIKLDWRLPGAQARPPGRRIVFPASTLARRGARELREVARRTLWPVALAGRSLEGADFWSGCNVVHTSGDWLNDAAAVVLPAWVEHQPRRLLAAIAAGVPAIASEECGLGGMSGVITVQPGDAEALSDALTRVMAEMDVQSGNDDWRNRRKLPEKIPAMSSSR